MSEQNQAIIPAAPATPDRPTDPMTSVRHLAYAWIGLWGVAAEDVGKFYQRCVKRGEQIVNAKAQAAPPPQAQPATPEAKKAMPKTVRPTTIFNVFGAVDWNHVDLNAEGLLPTKQEVDVLTERVEALTHEVEALSKQREQS